MCLRETDKRKWNKIKQSRWTKKRNDYNNKFLLTVYCIYAFYLNEKYQQTFWLFIWVILANIFGGKSKLPPWSGFTFETVEPHP